MNEDKLFAEALAFAALKHQGQARRNGTPYIYHPIKVAEMVQDAGYGIKYQIVALLHDVLEDTDATEDEVRVFGDDVLEAVKLVTRPVGANEAEYVANILTNHMVSVVKNADKINNLWESVHPDKPGTKRLAEDIDFSNRYIKKAKLYYYGKFSPALDMAIMEAKAELAWTSVREMKTPWNKATDMELYIEKEVKQPQIEAEKKERLHKLYETACLPDFAKDNLTFCRYDNKYYCIKDIKSGMNCDETWKLTEAGWLADSFNLKNVWEDVWTLQPDEMKKIIEKKKDEEYFYEFVDKSLL